jgi:hypothetical protein
MIYITPKKNDILYVKNKVKCIATCEYQDKALICDNEWWYSSINNFLEEKDVLVVLEVLTNKKNKKKRLKCLFEKEVVYIKEVNFIT